jgi:prepilin-type N-terminal cleavage/methylation domain-containing protein
MNLIKKSNLAFSFSLMELMIVITIIGILSSIAIPSYKNHVIKTRITEAITVAESWKSKLQLYYDANGSFPSGCPAGGDFADVNNPSPYVYMLRLCSGVGGDHRIRIEGWIASNVGSGLNSAGANIMIWLFPTVQNDTVVWQCGTHIDSPIYCKFLPSTCNQFCDNN